MEMHSVKITNTVGSAQLALRANLMHLADLQGRAELGFGTDFALRLGATIRGVVRV